MRKSLPLASSKRERQVTAMKRIFRPAMALLNRLKYAQKFAVIGIILLIPMVVMLFLLLQEQNSQIKELQLEQSGADYNSEVKAFLTHVQQHRGMASAFLNGDKSFEDQMKEKQAQIAEAIERIHTLEAQYGEVLGITERWTNIENEWLHIQERVFNMEAQNSFSSHTNLITQVLDLIVHVGDTSHLKTDPRLDGSYLAEGILKTLPQLTEQLGQMRAVGSGIATINFVTSDQSLQMTSLTDKSRSLLRDSIREVEVITGTNPNLKDRLDPLIEEAQTYVNEFLILTTAEILKSNTITINPGNYFDTATETISKVVSLYDANTEILKEYLLKQEEQLEQQRMIILIILGISILVAVYLFVGFYLSVRLSVSSLEKVAAKLAEGDLTTRVKLVTRDELSLVGDAFNKMADSFNEMIAKTKEVSEQVAASSEELTASAEQTSEATEQITNDVQRVAQGTETQLQGTEESARSLEEMASGIQRNAEKMSSVTELSGEAMDQAREGGKYVQETVRQMEQITTSVEGTDRVIRMLDQRSKEIGKMLEVITNIAEQTNLLALNAAIEAARAGEHGRGFAIVADEVRQLAEQSGASAKQIGELVGEIQKDMNQSVQAMDTVKSDVVSGTEKAQLTEQKFNQIVEAMQAISDQIQDVSATTQQLSAGAEQVSASVSQVADIARDASQNTQNVVAATEEQLASMEEITASASSLSKMAEELQELISRFKI